MASTDPESFPTSEDEAPYICTDVSDAETESDIVPIEECPRVSWTRVAIGRAIAEVSTDGQVKTSPSLLSGVTRGSRLPGTPYRFVTVAADSTERHTVYVHELIWLAFNGPVPEGWEVRHKEAHVCKGKTMYSNALRNLCIMKKMADRL
jgi:hypothetical protein